MIFNNCDQGKSLTDPIVEDVEKMAEVANLTANIIQETKISLEWEDNASSEIGFEIYERSGSRGEFIPQMQTVANVTSVMLDKHRRAFDLYYKVRAINKDGASGFSNVACAVGFQFAGVVPGTGHMHDIEFNPDGSLIAVAGEFTSAFGNGEVVIVDANGGGILTILATERQHGNSNAKCSKFSPDGKQLAVGTNDGRLEIWEVDSWELQRTYLEESEINSWFSGVRSIDFSPSGKYLAATISTINTIIISEFSTPMTIVRNIDTGIPYRDIHVRISPDDKCLAVLGFEPPFGRFPYLAVYRISDLHRMLYVETESETNYQENFHQPSIAFNPKKAEIAFSDGRNTRIINYITGETEKTFDIQENHVSFSPNGEYLISSPLTINFHNSETGEIEFSLAPFKGSNNDRDIRDYDVDYTLGRVALIKSNWVAERMDSMIEIWH